MTDIPTVSFWMGRPLSELTKEELIEAVEYLGRELKVAHESHKRTLDMWEVCQMARGQ